MFYSSRSCKAKNKAKTLFGMSPSTERSHSKRRDESKEELSFLNFTMNGNIFYAIESFICLVLCRGRQHRSIIYSGSTRLRLIQEKTASLIVLSDFSYVCSFSVNLFFLQLRDRVFQTASQSKWIKSAHQTRCESL